MSVGATPNLTITRLDQLRFGPERLVQVQSVTVEREVSQPVPDWYIPSWRERDDDCIVNDTSPWRHGAEPTPTAAPELRLVGAEEPRETIPQARERWVDPTIEQPRRGQLIDVFA